MSNKPEAVSSTSFIELSTYEGHIDGAIEGTSGSEMSVLYGRGSLTRTRDGNDGDSEERPYENATDRDGAIPDKAGTRPPEYSAEGLITLRQSPKDGDIRPVGNGFLIDFDIVVVHGLRAVRKAPWINAGAGNSEWLKMQGHCGKVMAFLYDPSQLLSGRYTRRSINKLATMLLENLMATRHQSTEKRPIMFVAHDLGGIIVKAALTAAGLNPRLYGEIFDFARILIFYGCPHRASDTAEMEENLNRFLYHPRSDFLTTLLPPVGTTRHLATAIAAINGLFMESKHMFRSYIISIYSDSDVSNVDKVFGIFTSTMGVPFETHFASGNNNYSQIETHVSHICPLIKVNAASLRLERSLLSVASPLPPFDYNPAIDHPFSWITTSRLYKSWYNQWRPQLLHLRGKSDMKFISEFIFHDLNKSRLQRNRQVNFYFTFNRHDLRRNNIRDMFAAFLAQFHGHFATLAAPLIEPFNRQLRGRNWNYEDLFSWFEELWRDPIIGSVFLVLNHFDECEPISRNAFLTSFSYVSETHEKPWKVLLTTQEPRVLSKELRSWPALDLNWSSSPSEKMAIPAFYSNQVSLLVASPETQYFKTQVNDDIKAIEFVEPEVQELILKHVSKNEHWPSQRCISDILGPVKEMSLESVVDKILSNIPDQYFALHALSWILYALRPPTLWELATAVAGTEKHATNNPFSMTSPVDEVRDRLQIWFAGIVTIQHNEVVISTRRIREILMATPSFDSVTSYLRRRVNKTAHINILGSCLAYLTIPETKMGLQDIYDNSRYDDTHLAMICDRTSLHSYATQFWARHLSLLSAKSYPSKEIELFVKSGAISSWAQARWVLANPFTRSQQPFKSLYPVLASIGLHDQAKHWLTGFEDLSAGLIEACSNASLHVAQQPLFRLTDSVEYLNEALASCGGNGNEAAWMVLISKIEEIYPDFLWKTRGTLVARASRLGLDKVLVKLLQLGCPAEEFGPAKRLSTTPLRLATQANNVNAARLLLTHGADLKQLGPYKETLVHIAAYWGHPEMIKLLVSHGANPNTLDAGFRSPIYVACNWARPRAVEALIELGANPNSKAAENQDKPGWSPLAFAISNKYVDCARALINGNADPNIVGYDGTPIQYAASKGLLETCEMLLEKRVDLFHQSIKPPILISAMGRGIPESRLEIIRLLVNKGARVHAEDASGNTTLMWACWSDDPRKSSIVEYLLEQGADVNCYNHTGVRPVHIAISMGDESLLSLLLRQERVDLNVLDPNNETPLKLAIGARHASMVKMLLEKGADPDFRPKGGDPALLEAVEVYQAEAVSLLIQYKAQIDPPDQLRNDKQWEPMECAVARGFSDIIRILGESGADVNRRFSNGRTLVHKGLDKSGLGALLEFRPNLDVKDNDGDTPLHGVDIDTPMENVKLLVRAGANINITNNRGATPLIEAILGNHEEAAKYYISKKASLNIVSTDGAALHVACLKGMVDLAKELIRAGADVNPTASDTAGTPLTSALLHGSEGYSGGNPPVKLGYSKMELVDILIGAGANIAAQAGLTFGTVGVAAAWGCNSDEIIALTHRGANFNIGDSMGRCPVHIAAARGSTTVLDSILDVGNRVVEKDWSGRNAVSWAAQGGNTEILYKLLELTGYQSIHEPDLSGWTPLSWAARGGSQGSKSKTGRCDLIKALLRLGADPSVKSHIQGKEYTPLGIATYHGRDQDVLKLLTNRGEDNKQLWGTGQSQNSESTDGIPHLAENTQLNDGKRFCDFCLLDVKGVRYDCTKCLDFCFCYKCYDLKDMLHPIDHEFSPVGDEFITMSSSLRSSPVPSSRSSSSILSSDSDDEDMDGSSI